MGYHYEGIENTIGRIIPETKSDPNRFGVYHGNVVVNGIVKKAQSTFFPREWSPWQVAYAILEAYENREWVKGTRNTYRGISSQGLTILMYLNHQDKIISAFPEE